MALKLRNRFANILSAAGFGGKFIRKNATINPLLASSLGGQEINPPHTFFRNTAAYRAVAIVGSCIDQIADDFQQLPFIINRITVKNNEIVRENITLEDRFKPFFKPNLTQTKASFIKKIIQQKNIVGEIFLEPVRGIRTAPPIEFHLLDPTNVDVKLNTKGIDKYIERINSAEKIWSPDPKDKNFLIYFCVEDPFQELRGTSPLDRLKSETALEWHAMRFALSFFKNGARFSNIVSYDDLVGKEALDIIKKDFMKSYGGSSAAFNTLFLDKGAKITEVGTSQQDMLFIDQLENVDRKIAGMYGVPSILIGLDDTTSLGNDIIDSQMKLYWGNTMKTQASVIDDWYTNFLLPFFTKPNSNERLEYVTDFSGVKALQKDMAIESARIIKELNNGLHTLGEATELVGGTTIKNPEMANLRLLPFAVEKAENKLFVEEPEPLLEETSSDEDEEETEKTIDADNVKIVHLTAKGRLDKLLKDKKRTSQFRRIDKQRQRVEKIFNTAYQKIADIQLKSVEAKLKRLDTKALHELYIKGELDSDDINKVLIKIPIGVQQLRRGFRPADMEGIDTAEKIVANETGLKISEVTVDNPNRMKIIRAREAFYPGVIADTNGMIRGILESGISENKDIADISKDIQALFNGRIKKSKADLIARTESVSVVNGGQLESMKSGGIEKKMWLTSRDDDVRDEHVVMDGETVGINEPFSNGSDVPDDFNERCTILAVK